MTKNKKGFSNKSPICMILLLMVMFIGKIEDNIITVKSIEYVYMIMIKVKV